MEQHLKDLRSNQHCNDRMQIQFNTTGNFHSTIIKQLDTVFRAKVLKVEQRYINKLSNSNEATASKNSSYNWQELLMDIVDSMLKG